MNFKLTMAFALMTLQGFAVRTPEDAVSSAYDELWTRFVSPHGIVYDYRGEIPSPKDCEEGRPNAMGWFSPIENGPMFTGPFLRAMVRRAKRTGSATDVERCRKLVEGLLLCADVCGTPGMICRGVGTDGKCHYPLGSCDQTVPWFLGVGAYLSSGFGPESLRDRAKRTMLRVAEALEKVEWRLPCDGRFSNEFRGCLMSDSLMFRGSVHGLFVLRILADVTGDGKWKRKYLAARDAKCPGGEGETRLEVCAYGYRFDLERAKRRFQMEPDQLWIYAGSTESLEELAEREEDPNAARLYRQGLANGARWALPFIEGYRQWDNRAERPFGFANWRKGYRWREQKTQKDAAQVADAAIWEVLGRRKSFERRYLTTPLAAAAICAMGDGDRDAIRRAIASYDYATPNISEFFYAVVAYESMKAREMAHASRFSSPD